MASDRHEQLLLGLMARVSEVVIDDGVASRKRVVSWIARLLKPSGAPVVVAHDRVSHDVDDREARRLRRVGERLDFAKRGAPPGVVRRRIGKRIGHE
jgi:hypothetical protein